MIRLKNLWHKKYKHNPNQHNRDGLTDTRILIGEAIRQFKLKQWEKFIKKMGPNPLSTTPFWRRINRLRGKKQSANINTLEHNGEKITSDKAKAEIFADRLETVFKDDEDPKFDVNTKNIVDEFINSNKIESHYQASEKTIPLLSKN